MINRGDTSILTITTAATNRKLCTLAALKAELNITVSTYDVALGALITDASGAIETYCRRIFAAETVQEVWRSYGAMEAINAARYPITSITSLVLDGDALVADTDYETDFAAGLLYRLSGDAKSIWRGTKIALTYAAGYTLPDDATPTLPVDVARACVLTAAAWHLNGGRNALVRSESAQDVGQISYLDPRADDLGLPPVAAGLLSGFVARRV